MKRTILAAALLLTACALTTGCTTPKWLENVAACSVDGKEAYVVSKWGPLGIASSLKPASICQK